MCWSGIHGPHTELLSTRTPAPSDWVQHHRLNICSPSLKCSLYDSDTRTLDDSLSRYGVDGLIVTDLIVLEESQMLNVL